MACAEFATDNDFTENTNNSPISLTSADFCCIIYTNIGNGDVIFMKKFLSCAVLVLAVLLCGCNSTSSGGGSTSVYVPTYDDIVSKSQPNSSSTVSDTDKFTTSSKSSSSESSSSESSSSKSSSSKSSSSKSSSSKGSSSGKDDFIIKKDSKKDNDDKYNLKNVSSRPEPEPTPEPVILSKNGYVICPDCTFVHLENVECAVCNRAPNTGLPCVTQNCPTCGGGFSITDVRPWVKCGYCDDYFVSCDDPVFDCVDCKRKNLKGSEMSKIDPNVCEECYKTIG